MAEVQTVIVNSVKANFTVIVNSDKANFKASEGRSSLHLEKKDSDTSLFS